MQRNINNEFERFLKENADQYRLYPSTKVWKGIHSALHSRRRWYGLGILLLLITGTLITLLITKTSKQAPVALSKPSATFTTQPTEDPAGSSMADTRTVTGNSKPGNSESNNATPNSRRNNNNQSYSILYDNGVYNTTTNVSDVTDPELTRIDVQSVTPTQNNIVSPVHPATNNAVASNQNYLSSRSANDNKEINAQPPVFNNIVSETDNDHQVITAANADDAQKQSASERQKPVLNVFDWTIESVLNTFTGKKKHKIDLELDLTPTISYRKLSENKAFLRSGGGTPGYTYAALYDINNVVTHKPDMGLEIGLTAKYAIASNIKVKAGIQFNVNRYDIKAFNYPLEVATIALSAGRQQVDSFRAVSSYRNFNGYKSNWLENFYFQVSLPIGVEVKLAGDEKVQFGLAGTIQPTYVIGDRAYLLSTDYKNYAEVPWLIRRWNANTAFETFVAYSTGKLKWQVGPQVRYQLLSSFKNKYPVKENLFDFGLKIGLSLNN